MTTDTMTPFVYVMFILVVKPESILRLDGNALVGKTEPVCSVSWTVFNQDTFSTAVTAFRVGRCYTIPFPPGQVHVNQTESAIVLWHTWMAIKFEQWGHLKKGSLKSFSLSTGQIFQPELASNAFLARVTSNTVILKQPYCVFNQSCPGCEIWLVAGLCSGKTSSEIVIIFHNIADFCI